MILNCEKQYREGIYKVLERSVVVSAFYADFGSQRKPVIISIKRSPNIMSILNFGLKLDFCLACEAEARHRNCFSSAASSSAAALVASVSEGFPSYSLRSKLLAT